jgi:hypothetical protein
MSELRSSKTGEIDKLSIREHSCSTKLSSDKTLLKATYQKSNVGDTIYFGPDRKLYYGFSANLINSFTTSQGKWMLYIDHHTVHYEIVFRFPSSRLPKTCKLSYYTISSPNEAEEMLETKPLLIGNTISVDLFNVNADICYELSWEW